MRRYRYLTIALFAGALLSTPTARADDDPLNALMMGGTTAPTPSEFWQDTIVTDYIDPATHANYTPVLVPTPESLATTSVPVGLADLQAAMGEQPPDQPVGSVPRREQKSLRTQKKRGAA